VVRPGARRELNTSDDHYDEASFGIFVDAAFALLWAPAGVNGARYFTPAPHLNERLANIFSRTIAYAADGMDALVFRASGSAVYTVLRLTPSSLVFDLQSQYDGRPESQGTHEVKDGGRTGCYKDACGPVTDASGLSITHCSGARRRGRSVSAPGGK